VGELRVVFTLVKSLSADTKGLAKADDTHLGDLVKTELFTCLVPDVASNRQLQLLLRYLDYGVQRQNLNLEFRLWQGLLEFGVTLF
jgi:hypothetical protein